MSYPSRYSSGKSVRAAQYITEIVCERKAALNGAELPAKFWNMPQWKKFYQMQIIAANALLRIYDERAIIAALKSNQARKIYSLHAPFLDDIIKAEQAKVDKKKDIAPVDFLPIERADTTAKPRQEPQKKSHISRLKELE